MGFTVMGTCKMLMTQVRMCFSWLKLSRFLSSPFIIRVPFFLIFSFNKGTRNKKGKRVLPRNLVVILNPEPDSRITRGLWFLSWISAHVHRFQCTALVAIRGGLQRIRRRTLPHPPTSQTQELFGVRMSANESSLTCLPIPINPHP